MLRPCLLLCTLALILSGCSGGTASNAETAARPQGTYPTGARGNNRGTGDPMPAAQLQSSRDADGNTFRSAVPQGTVPSPATTEPPKTTPKILVVAPPSYQLDPPPTPDQARQAIWDAMQGRHASKTADKSAPDALSDEAAQTLMSQTTADACTTTALSLAVCRVTVGDKSHWLRFRLIPNGTWVVDGLSMPPPGGGG